MALHDGERFPAARWHVSAKRVEAADERPVGMHGASLRPQEHARVVRSLELEDRPAILGEVPDKLRHRDAAVFCQAQQLVGIEHNALAVTAASASIARIAEPASA